MKTAISVEDDLLKETDRVAQEIGVSRSHLVSLALRDYLTQRRQQEITAQLNEVYRGEQAPPEVRPFKQKLRRIVKDRW